MKLNITAATRDDLHSKVRSYYLATIKNQNCGRSFDFEDGTICVLLGCIANLSFPLELIGNVGGIDVERPDFRVRMAGLNIGIEITKAANRDYEWAKNIASHNEDAVLEPCLFTPGIQIEAGSGYKPPVCKTNKPLLGPGWMGHKPEEEWSSYIFQSIEGKTIKLAEDSFSRFNENWLLIHDSTPVKIFIHDEFLNVGIQMLQTKMGQNYWRKPIAFDRIFIQCHEQMVLLEKAGCSKFPFPSWKP